MVNCPTHIERDLIIIVMLGEIMDQRTDLEHFTWMDQFWTVHHQWMVAKLALLSLSFSWTRKKDSFEQTSKQYSRGLNLCSSHYFWFCSEIFWNKGLIALKWIACMEIFQSHAIAVSFNSLFKTVLNLDNGKR